jgi:hypothetical protein
VTSIGKNTNATIAVSKDSEGTVVEATVSLDKTGATNGKSVSATISKTVMGQVNDILGDAADSAKITMTVKDESGKERYSITVSGEDLTPNNSLYIYTQDKNGNYVMVNAKEYTTDDNGQLKVSIKSNKDFVMLNEEQAQAATKEILSTVQPAKKTTSVSKSKTTKMTLSSKLNTDNVKSVTYKTSKSSVATVNKNGKITGKKSGTATVSAVVTLKNGSKKTVKMKVTVK